MNWRVSAPLCPSAQLEPSDSWVTLRTSSFHRWLEER